MISKRVCPSLYTYNLLLKCTRECSIGDEFETRKIIGQIINDPYLLTIESTFKVPDISEKHELDTSLISNNYEDKLSPIENRPNLLDVKPYFGHIVAISDIKTPIER